MKADRNPNPFPLFLPVQFQFVNVQVRCFLYKE